MGPKPWWQPAKAARRPSPLECRGRIWLPCSNIPNTRTRSARTPSVRCLRQGVTDDNALFDYYKQIGTATDLPLFVQSQPFPMSMDLIVRMYKEIPSFRQIKDEAGDTLARITEIRTRTNDGIKVFTGNGVRNMINELMLGAQGYCPTVDLADIYAQAFDLWYAGKHSEAFDMFGRVLCFGTISETVGAPGKYVLVARGVFKNTRSRGVAP